MFTPMKALFKATFTARSSSCSRYRRNVRACSRRCPSSAPRSRPRAPSAHSSVEDPITTDELQQRRSGPQPLAGHRPLHHPQHLINWTRPAGTFQNILRHKCLSRIVSTAKKALVMSAKIHVLHSVEHHQFFKQRRCFSSCSRCLVFTFDENPFSQDGKRTFTPKRGRHFLHS